MKTFQYYQIRCCWNDGGTTHSFLGELCEIPPGPRGFTKIGAYNEAEEASRAFLEEHGYRDIFWTLYGIEPDGCSLAIGDFVSFEAAYEVLSMILAPIRAAADQLVTEAQIQSPLGEHLSELACVLEDICNQSTTEERL